MMIWRIGAALLALLWLGACSSDDSEDSDGSDGSDDSSECVTNDQDPSRYVLVGFYKTTDCSGEPVQVNAFPVDPGASCYCWPGSSGKNSADAFTCDANLRTFTYTQYNSLTCGAGDDTPTTKTVSESCEQDIPPELYSKIIDYGACGG